MEGKLDESQRLSVCLLTYENSNQDQWKEDPTLFDFEYTENSTCPNMCLPKDNEVCNDTVSPVYIKHDGKIDHWLTDIKLQECKNKTPEPIIVIPNAKKVDEDWILVIIFVIGTALILAFLIYFLLYLFKNYKNQPQGPPMTRLINSFRTVSGARPSWLKRSNDFGGTRSSALKSYCDTTDMMMNPLYHEFSMLQTKLIPRSQIEVKQEIASGQFGKVFKGVLKSNDGFEDTEIAIKAPKVNLISSDSVNDFYREANTAVSFDHINVLKCLGMSEEPKELPYLIFEFMHFGDLATILASNRVNGQSEKAPLLTQANLWSFSLQIARGMLYLTNQRYIHRDVAARNCLVNKDMEVKISDFGLSRALYTSDYYEMGDHRMLPIRWMAPETIQYTCRKFSSASDVWAYGITIWELYTLGQKPYFNLSNQDVLIKIAEEKLTLVSQIPDTCPGRLQHILKKCWHYEPENRYNFQEIVEILESPYENAQEFENSSYMDPTFDDYETPNTIPNCYIDVDVRNTVWIKPRSERALP